MSKGRNNLVNRLDDPPVVRGQRNHRDSPARKILLVFNREVASYENLLPGIFRRLQKSAIFQPTPACKNCRDCFMRPKVTAQLVRQVFIEKNLHGTGCSLRANSRMRRIVSSGREGKLSWISSIG